MFVFVFVFVFASSVGQPRTIRGSLNLNLFTASNKISGYCLPAKNVCRVSQVSGILHRFQINYILQATTHIRVERAARQTHHLPYLSRADYSCTISYKSQCHMIGTPFLKMQRDNYLRNVLTLTIASKNVCLFFDCFRAICINTILT